VILMIVGQTMLSVLKGTEHRAEAALRELAAVVGDSPGHRNHRILRSFGMSPLASALHDERREAALGDVHFVFETQWETLDDHDDFYTTDVVKSVYDGLRSILTSGPFEVLYDSVVEQPQHHNVAI
jgi:heme-degrading monooxygenase HmoA